MATPAPFTVSDDADRYQLLEIADDAPAAPVPTPAATPAPATPAHTAAMVFTTAPGMLRGVDSLPALGAAMQALAASLAALGVRQDDPRREPLRAIARAVRCAFVWVALWRPLARAIAERPAYVRSLGMPATPATPAPVAAPVTAAPVSAVAAVEATVPGSASKPHAATYTKLRSGEWGARVQSGAVKLGDHVRVTKRSGEQQDRAVTHVWWCQDDTALVSVGPIPAAPAATAPAANVRQAIPTIPATAPAPVATPATATEQTGSLVEALGNIATEGASNAATQGIGSMAGGQLRGVGFSTAAGYVTALANGVKRATADGYLATLRGSYGYTAEQIAALTVTIIPEAQGPAGRGIVHTPTENAANMTPAERRRLWSMTPAQRLEAEAAHKANREALVRLVSLTATGGGAIVSLGTARHGATATLVECEAAVTSIGRKDLAPRGKSAKAQFGDIMGRFSRGGFKAWAARRSQTETWPADVVSRWIVGELNGSAVLGSLGDKQIVAELLRTGEIRFVGGSAEQRERVRTEYQARRAEQTLDATDLRDWIVTTIEREWHATTWAGCFFVPGAEEQIAPVRAFIEAIGACAGRSVEVAYLESAKHLAGGLARGLVDDVMRIAHDLDASEELARKQARANATKEGADPELAARRAVISPEVTATYHKKCDELAVKIDGYAMLVGDEIKPARAALTAVRDRIPAVDPTSMRAAMLELE